MPPLPIYTASKHWVGLDVLWASAGLLTWVVGQRGGGITSWCKVAEFGGTESRKGVGAQLLSKPTLWMHHPSLAQVGFGASGGASWWWWKHVGAQLWGEQLCGRTTLVWRKCWRKRAVAQVMAQVVAQVWRKLVWRRFGASWLGGAGLAQVSALT